MVSTLSSILSQLQIYFALSHDVASGSDITLCNNIDKPLVVYRFLGNVIASVITLRK